MCGIAGYRYASLSVPPPLLSRMAERLGHRGPDGCGEYREGRIGLAHTRLAIIDLEGGAQPLYSADRALVLVANGEIYNYRELRGELEALGHRFATHSDCETILHAYAAWGKTCLDRLQGMFAFALYDQRQGSLWLARDRLGIKPLYFTHNRHGFAFASEAKALLPFLASVEVDPTGLASFLQNNFTVGPCTLLRGVRKLQPGEHLSLDRDGVENLASYWSPLQVKPRHIGLDAALHEFDGLMDQVIDIHLRADVPQGLFLSGGVDSSLLAALISRRTAEPLRTFSVGFPDTSAHNELDAAAYVAQRCATRHTALAVSADEVLGRLPAAVWAADDLTADYANLPLSILAQAAGAELKVVFSGEGGDEVFAGYGRYRSPAIRRWWAKVRRPGSGGFRTRGLCDGLSMAFAPSLRDALTAWRRPYQEAWMATPKTWSDTMRRQYLDMRGWLPDDLLVKSDRMLMAWGVEGRVPFLDHRVVEFGLALPDTLKVSGRDGKWFLKRWGERFFPREHLWGRKRGFTVPVGDWLRGERLTRIAEALECTEAVRQWFSPGGFNRLLAAQARHGRHGPALWAWLNFAIWHRIFIERGGERPPPLLDPVSYLES